MAGNRSITVTLRANVSDFKSQFDAATRAVDSTSKATEGAGKRAETAMGRMVQSATQNSAAWRTAGTTMAGFGVAALGGLGLATKAAMDWESAWAGVTKTVDGSSQQMSALESGLRGLARELPASHQEIAAVAEAAGQLGIETPNVLGFTRTMINMGEATNLSAEEAATSLARFSNVMGTNQSDIGKLGASIVGLGNNFATTESEIVQMAQRLSGAGAQANLTEGDVLGIATAMSSVGIEAEAGGSAMSQTMKRIGKSVDEGGSKLDLFAQVSGMSAEQFSAAWKSDPASALDAFVTGLSGVESQGMTTNGVLTELGITGIREADALLRLSAASGDTGEGMSLLAKATQMGNSEFDKGTALVAEAAKRYETAESKIKIARNALVDFGISVGGTLLPAVAGFADKAGDMAGWFADLPAPVQKAGAVLVAFGGTSALAIGGFVRLVPGIIETVNAFKALPAPIGKVSKALGALTLAAGATTLLSSLGDGMTDFSLGANEAADKATRLASATDPLGVAFEGMGMDADLAKQSTADLATGLDVLANGRWWGGIQDAGTNLTNLFGAGNATLAEQKARLEELGTSLAAMSSVDMPKAQASFKALYEAMGGTEQVGANLLKLMPTFRDQLAGLASGAGLDATDTMVLLKIATGELSPVVDDATGAVTGYTEGMEDAANATADAAEAASDAVDNIVSLGNAFLEARGAVRDYADAQKDANKASKENGKHWEDGSKAANANAEALDNLASAALSNLDAMSKNGDATSGAMQQARDDLIDTAIQMGASKDEAREYVDQLGLTPEAIDTQVELDTEVAQAEWNDLYQKLWPNGGHPPMVLEVDADTSKASEKTEQFTGTVMNGPPVDQKVGADTTSAAQGLYGFQETVEGTTATTNVDADTTLSQVELDNQIFEINRSGGTVQIDGETVPASRALSSILDKADGSEATMTIDGNNSEALGALNGTVTVVNNADGTVTIKGNSDPAESALSTVKNAIDAAAGIIDIQGDNSKANAATNAAKSKADNTSGTMGIKGNNSAAQNSLSNVLGSVNRSHGTMGINGNASGARNATQGAVGYANRSRGSIKVSALTGAANSAISNAARSRTAYIHVVASGVSAAMSVISRAVNHRAAGGPINGPGTGTSDSIPAMLSNGEHVWTAAEVAALGGHQAMYNLRARALAGERFAVGGGVEHAEAMRLQAVSTLPAPYWSSAPAAPSTRAGDTFIGYGFSEKELAKNWRTEQAREAAVKTRHRRF